MKKKERENERERERERERARARKRLQEREDATKRKSLCGDESELFEPGESGIKAQKRSLMKGLCCTKLLLQILW